MIERNDLAVLTLAGPDAAQFLHNQLTVDVRSLASGDSSFASLCQPKGRVIALLGVMATEGGLNLVCHESLADGLLAHLKRFVFREKVAIERPEGLRVLSLDAEASADVVSEPLAGFRYALMESSPSPAQSSDDVRARELAAGIAWLDAHSTETFLPQMLGHEVIGALDFRKGCFPGQEVIARTRYLGKLKRHPWTGIVPERLSIDVLEDVTLSQGGEDASGVLVDQAERADGAWQVFVVARRPEPLVVDTLSAGGSEWPASGRWLNDSLPER